MPRTTSSCVNEGRGRTPTDVTTASAVPIASRYVSGRNASPGSQSTFALQACARMCSTSARIFASSARSARLSGLRDVPSRAT